MSFKTRVSVLLQSKPVLAFVLVVMIIFLFLRNWRTTLIPALA